MKKKTTLLAISLFSLCLAGFSTFFVDSAFAENNEIDRVIVADKNVFKSVTYDLVGTFNAYQGSSYISFRYEADSSASDNFICGGDNLFTLEGMSKGAHLMVECSAVNMSYVQIFAENMDYCEVKALDQDGRFIVDEEIYDFDESLDNKIQINENGNVSQRILFYFDFPSSGTTSIVKSIQIGYSYDACASELYL